MKKVTSALVTGATGFIGSNLVKRLVAEGVETYCLLRETSPRSRRIAAIKGLHPLFIKSFAKPELQSGLAKVRTDVVFHLAAYGVGPRHRDPDLTISANVTLLIHLIDIIKEWGIYRFIHTGSCSEYAPAVNQIPITEAHPIEPISIYGAAKAASVLFGNALARNFDIPFVSLRPFGVYGIGEATHRLIPYLLSKLILNEKVDLTPGEQIRDFLNIADVVEAFVQAAAAPDLPANGIYNICSGIPITVRHVAEAVATALSKPVHLLKFGARPYRRDEPMWVVGDPSRWMRITGWRPRVSLQKGIYAMIDQAFKGRKKHLQ